MRQPLKDIDFHDIQVVFDQNKTRRRVQNPTISLESILKYNLDTFWDRGDF